MTTEFKSISRAPKTGQAKFEGRTKRDLDFPLTAEQLTTYQEKGFVVIRGVFDRSEMELFRQESLRMQKDGIALCENLGLNPADNMRLDLWPKDGEDVIWKIDPFTTWSPIFAAMTKDRRIMDRLASIYDGHEASMFKDKLIYKPPGTHGNHLHQDYNWWRGFPLSLLSVSIPLDATTKENGCTQMWTGHKRGFLHEGDDLNAQIPEGALDNEEHHYVEMELGDIAIFHCHTPHAAGNNESDDFRRAIFLSYNDSRDGEHYQEHYDHFHWYINRGRDEETQRRRYFL